MLEDDAFDVRTWTVPAPEGEAGRNDWLETLSTSSRARLVAATQRVMQANIDWFAPIGPGCQLQFHVAGAQTCRFEGGAPGYYSHLRSACSFAKYEFSRTARDSGNAAYAEVVRAAAAPWAEGGQPPSALVRDEPAGNVFETFMGVAMALQVGLDFVAERASWTEGEIALATEDYVSDLAAFSATLRSCGCSLTSTSSLPREALRTARSRSRAQAARPTSPKTGPSHRPPLQAKRGNDRPPLQAPSVLRPGRGSVPTS